MKNIRNKTGLLLIFSIISIFSYSQCEDFVVDTATVKQTSPIACDGQITLLPSGGTPPYSYSIYASDTAHLVSTSQITSNLCENVYICVVRDTQGCEYTRWIPLMFCNGFDAHFTHWINPYNLMCNGELTVSLTGGTPPYTYLWYMQGGDVISHVDTAFTNLCPGTYCLLGHDANNCEVSVGYGLSNSTVDTCNNFDFSFTINDALTSDTDCNGWINLDVTGGTLPYIFNWEDEFGNSMGSDTSRIENLCVGSYYLTITDSLGCSMENGFSQYVEDSCEVISLLVIPQHPGSELTCDGHLSVYAWYNWNYHSTTAQLIESPDYNSLCAGIYNVSYTNSPGCTKYKTVELGADPFQTLNAYVVTGFDNYTNNCNGNAKVFAGGGTPPYTFNHSGEQTGQFINGLCPGLYELTVTDANLESFVTEYVISDLKSTYLIQTFPDSVSKGEISSAPIELCFSSYYHLIKDLHIESYEYLNNQLTVNWVFTYGAYTTTETQTQNIVLEPGVYNVELELYCLSKSEARYLTAKDQVYIEANNQNVEINKNRLNVTAHPNPFSDNFIISTETVSDHTVKLISLNGKVILNKLYRDTDEINIDVNDLDSGFYIVSVSSDSGTVNLKMIKR